MAAAWWAGLGPVGREAPDHPVSVLDTQNDASLRAGAGSAVGCSAAAGWAPVRAARMLTAQYPAAPAAPAAADGAQAAAHIPTHVCCVCACGCGGWLGACRAMPALQLALPAAVHHHPRAVCLPARPPPRPPAATHQRSPDIARQGFWQLGDSPGGSCLQTTPRLCRPAPCSR